MSARVRTFIVFVCLLVMFLAAYMLVRDEHAGLPQQPETQLWNDAAAGSVSRVDVRDDDVIAYVQGRAAYRVPMGWSYEADAYVRQFDVDVVQVDSGMSDFEMLLAGLLGLFFVLVLVIVILRRLNANQQQTIFGMRRTTARFVNELPKVGFADVGGAVEAKAALADLVDFLKAPARWEKAGARLPRGVLLEGPPGHGKTLLARALAGEAKVPFFEVSATEFVELFVGVGAARVRDLFEEARRKAPCVVFIDELDAVGRRRGASSTALVHQEREQALNQLLVSLDGFRGRDRVVVLAATNRADVLDPALMRPGRFDLRLPIGAHDDSDRLAILQVHAKSKAVGGDVDLAAIAARTAGFSGADLEHLCNEATMSAVRRAAKNGGEAKLERADFDAAIARKERVEGSRFDKLDIVLVESNSQIAQPTGRTRTRLRMRTGETIEGEVVWADSTWIKLRSGDDVTIANRGEIATLVPLAGTEGACGEEPRSLALDAVDAG